MEASCGVRSPKLAQFEVRCGRVTSVSPCAMNADGIRRYTRPEGKSGGHGVGLGLALVCLSAQMSRVRC